MADLQYVQIQELIMGCGSSGEVLIGLVISKREVNSFQSTKSESGSTRQVFSFTLRDTTTHWLTVNVWGDEEYIGELFNLFQIGDTLELKNFQVQPKTENHEKFNPYSSTQVCVHLSQRSEGNISLYQGPYTSRLQTLANYPVCDPKDFYTIAEASDEQSNLANQCVNLLACVRKIGSVQQLKSKAGKDLTKIELLLMDNTANSFLLTIWDKSTCEWASTWQEMTTVILATDLRVAYSDFKKKIVATSTSRTIFICNPETEDTVKLFHFAQEVAATQGVIGDGGFNEDNNGFVDETPMVQRTVNELLTEFSAPNLPPDKTERAYLMAVLTSLDIDSPRSKTFISYRCSACSYSVGDENAVSCPNSKCATSNGDVALNIVPCYDIRVDISDHTGTLSQARLSNKAAEEMFNMKLQEFIMLTEVEATSLKWKWLLERVRCNVRCSLTKHGRMFTRIDNCRRATVEELMQFAIITPN